MAQCVFIRAVQEQEQDFHTQRPGRDYLYAKTRVFGQVCAVWGSLQYPTTFRGQTPKRPP